ncbi:uncharacterized protein LOC111385673 isoform X2 [Olea europaea var. sylvestris]|uniref:Uncharacterized protein n=1 Tax=Olea europaea subsp. europaea TaxID=158383 RepID=A0A8S0Q9Z2_OLEEU|nr:uncharacterized protein LOC111385673 isoform X2 [Olea europaea var. sylvestris]CAA2963853.1 Hypothetical predicted protein [Olea europaea subsp. europaea]
MKMEFSMRFLAVMSLLLLVSMSTDMGGPLMADASWDLELCDEGCKLLGYKRGCCGITQDCMWCFCSDEDSCPITEMEIKIGEKTMMIAATPKKSFIKESVA